MNASTPDRARDDDDARREVAFGVLLFVIALAPRLYVALAWGGEPVWDGHYYDFGARRIAAGFGYSDDLMLGGQSVWHPWCHYPVGYSAFLSFFYRYFAASTKVAAVVNALTGAALAMVTWRLARHAMGPLRARVAGLLVALHPGLVLYAALVMTEPLAALLTLSAFWVAVAVRRSALGALFGALVLGLAALVRPQALLCAPFLGLMAVHRAPAGSTAASVARAFAGAVVVSAVALLPVLPWTARNCRVMDGCALVSTNAGWNLAIGAFPRATGRFETLRASDGCREVTGQVQQDRCWLHYGAGEIAAHPLHWLALVPAKLGFTFDHESFAVEYLHEARPEAWPEERRVRFRQVTTAAHRALVCLAALGCVGLAVRGAGIAVQASLALLLGLLAYIGYAADAPTFWPLVVATAIVPWLPLPGAPPWPWGLRLGIALLGTTVLTHAVFFGEDRYHLVVTPVLCLMAAAALRRSQEA